MVTRNFQRMDSPRVVLILINSTIHTHQFLRCAHVNALQSLYVPMYSLVILTTVLLYVECSNVYISWRHFSNICVPGYSGVVCVNVCYTIHVDSTFLFSINRKDKLSSRCWTNSELGTHKQSHTQEANTEKLLFSNHWCCQ